MKSSQLKPTLLFLAWVAAIAVATGALKVGITWSAETHLYQIPIAGGLLKSLEIVELSNILVFALLGLGLGMTTIFLSYGRSRLKTFAIFLAMIILAGGVFCLGYATRQYLWIQQVADEASISFAEAKTLTHDFLSDETGSAGLWGFYRYTTQVPILPTKTGEIASLTDDEKWFRSELTRFSGLEPGIFSRVFSIAGWGIRGFYMALAGFTFIIYYFKGLDWVEHRRVMRRPLPAPTPASRTRRSTPGKTAPRPMNPDATMPTPVKTQSPVTRLPKPLGKVVRTSQSAKRSPHPPMHRQGQTKR